MWLETLKKYFSFLFFKLLLILEHSSLKPLSLRPPGVNPAVAGAKWCFHGGGLAVGGMSLQRMVISTLLLCGFMKGGRKKNPNNLSLMGFGDKKLTAPGPSLLFLSGSSVAQPIGELRASVALETREHRAGASPW